ncbi:zinc-dependent alcohol dehydrogenase family protein [Congregibacter brevis]|uniref:Zinc-dependent alcohol dehydrogenase family protein n=1 Tax=Congregibacter brevis TaxID=3081201 RepID=A0ABZ0IH45_9GAMM|nr:zinc-dependent alcohol dehydrogenase family protein [Congregibacter sp. IMCC45268]
MALQPNTVRVAMTYAPINPSDLIPITGAYRQRIGLPTIAGYEGVGLVIEAPAEFSHLLGQRVLPLRGEGTWQTVVDCPATCAVEVPDGISDLLAARAYINPLAALTMLHLWPPKGKVILLTAAGSECAEYLGRWALRQGAARVLGIYRSECRVDRLAECGIEPISILDRHAIHDASVQANIAFDALGGEIGTAALGHMRHEAKFVSYGLLSNEPVAIGSEQSSGYHRFHLRDHLPSFLGPAMQNAFAGIWPRLAETGPLAPRVFGAQYWQEALEETTRPGGRKSVLDLAELS